jgi:hypothetical protein
MDQANLEADLRELVIGLVSFLREINPDPVAVSVDLETTFLDGWNGRHCDQVWATDVLNGPEKTRVPSGEFRAVLLAAGYDPRDLALQKRCLAVVRQAAEGALAGG